MRYVTMNARRFRALLALLIAAAVAVSLLALVGTKPAEAAFPGTNGKIAFSSDRIQPGLPEIYVMNPNGSLQTRFTNSPNSIDWKPSFSSDGRKIVFESYRDGNGNIYMMDAVDSNSDSNGDNLKRLTKNTGDDEDPTFSPSGTKKIAFTSNRVTRANPDGDYEIYVMKAKPEGTKNHPRQLTNNVGITDEEPSFSPDGTKIVFTSDRDGDDNIYMMNVDGTGFTQLTADPNGDGGPSFSPDGTKIVFSSRRNGNPKIYVMDAKDEEDNVTHDSGPDGEGDNMIPITNDPNAFDGFAAFSPEQDKIVFSRFLDEYGEREILVIAANGSGDPARLTNNTAADSNPDWGVAPT